MVKIEDIYEEYRQRLLTNKVPIINLERFETFTGRDMVSNSLDLLDTLLENDTKQIIELLEQIKLDIFNGNAGRYSDTEKTGYYLIAEGYILRLKNREIKKKV